MISLLKEDVEQFLKSYADEHPEFTVNISKTGTGVNKSGIFQMSIYYRVDALRIEIKPGTTQHGEYESLLKEQLIYQRDSANPYSTAGRISFFIEERNMTCVLQRLLESQALPTDEQMTEFTTHAQQYKEYKQQRQMDSGRAVLNAQISNTSNVIKATDNTGISSELSQGSQIDALKQIPYKDICKLFYDWLIANGISPVSASTNVSDCFYIWRKENSAQFWAMVESEESISRTILYETLSKYSTANPNRVIAGYLRAVQRFRGFVTSWSGADLFISTQTEDPHHLGPQQKLDESLAVPTLNAEGNLAPQIIPQQGVVTHHSEDNRRIERKLDSLIGAIATIYSGKNAVAEPVKPKEEEKDRRFMDARESTIFMKTNRPSGNVVLDTCLTVPADISALNPVNGPGGSGGDSATAKYTLYAADTDSVYSCTFYGDTAGSWYRDTDKNIRQGYLDMGSNGRQIQNGCFWFDISSYRSMTVLSAALTLTRKSGYGTSGEVMVDLWGTASARREAGSYAAQNKTHYGELGTIGNGETKEFVIPVQAFRDLQNGVINGLMLRSSDRELKSGRGYSRNYAVFYGSDSGSCRPALNILGTLP